MCLKYSVKPLLFGLSLLQTFLLFFVKGGTPVIYTHLPVVLHLPLLLLVVELSTVLVPVALLPVVRLPTRCLLRPLRKGHSPETVPLHCILGNDSLFTENVCTFL